jgi:L,D-transpeptidase ErfK/SrfK
MKFFTCLFLQETGDRQRKFLGRFLLLVMMIAAATNIGFTAEVWSQTGLTYTYVDTPKNQPPSLETVTMIGHPITYVVRKGDTLLDIARDYRLGYNEVEALYPEINPWVPPVGKELILPKMWVLPQVRKPGIVINLAEFRLYHFIDKALLGNSLNHFQEEIKNGKTEMRFVRTYPVGIGNESWNSPIGMFRIIDKRVNPTWYIPPSLKSKYHPIKVIPPGPKNPLGNHFMGIGNAYGIHGTDNPWSVGRMVTHGCIRLYPEDIEFLYTTVTEGTPVQIVYEPVKIGFLNGSIYVEVHKDIYEKISNFNEYGYQKLADLGLMEAVEPALFEAELERKSGMPVEVGIIDLPDHL